MAVYHYKHALIKEVEVTSPHAGATQASIVARDDAPPEQLAKLRFKLAGQSVTTLMDSENGHAILRVRGLKNEKQLTHALQKTGLGPSSDKTLTAADRNHQKARFSERVRNRSLLLSALFYDLGNIALFVSGIQRGRHNPDGKMTSNDRSEFNSGLAFAVGDILMTIYGDKKGDGQLQAAANSLEQHLREKGIAIPEGAALDPDSLHQSGAMQEINNWMRRHIIHIKSLTEISGGLHYIHSGTKAGNFNREKVIAGALLSTGWLATFLLDKSHKPPVLDNDASDGVIGKMRANPRGWIARPLAMGNNIFTLWGTSKERTKFRQEAEAAKAAFAEHATEKNEAELARHIAKQHDYVANVFTASSFLVAHSLFGMSGSKRPQETRDDKEVMADLVLLSANMLAQQPEAVRKRAVDETAEYIAKMPHMAQGQEQIAAAINAKIDGLAKSGWVARTGQDKEGVSITR